MARKPESVFRATYVQPFLKTLQNMEPFPIQQVAIVGDPDYLLCILGRFVALELKALDGELSAMQIHRLARVEKCGGVALVADPKNWSQIKNKLRNLDEGIDND